jgi:hypothetical protein
MLSADTPKKYADARTAMWALLPKNHRDIINRLIESIGAHRTGPDTGYTYRKYDNMPMPARGDNSNSQYAMLGYKAAALLGAEFDPQVFLDEAKRLLEQQNVVTFLPEVPAMRRQDMKEAGDPKKRTGTASTVKPTSWTYSAMKSTGCVPQMTAAGISSLMISLDELKLRGKLDKKLEQQIESCISSSLATLQLKFYDEDGRNELWGSLSETQAGWGLFYNLYSVERGCRMAGVRFLGGEVDWHTIGSEILVKLQRKDGSWAGERYNGPVTSTVKPSRAGDAIDTCLAILFLKAAALPVITEPGGKSDSGD